MDGGTVSTLVTVWLHVLELLQQSVACQVRVMVPGHEVGLLVTVLKTVSVILVPQQASSAVGVSNVQALPHCTGLLVGQAKTGGIVSETVTTWLQIGEVFPQQSTACHLRVNWDRQGEKTFVNVPVISTVMF